MATERERDESDLIELLDQYRAAIAVLDCLPRDSDQYVAQLRVEEDLSRRIHLWATGGGVTSAIDR